MNTKTTTPIHRLINDTDASDISNQPIPTVNATMMAYAVASLTYSQAMIERSAPAQTSRVADGILSNASSRSGIVAGTIKLTIQGVKTKAAKYWRTATAVRLARRMVARPILIAIGVSVSLLSGALWESLATSVSR